MMHLKGATAAVAALSLMLTGGVAAQDKATELREKVKSLGAVPCPIQVKHDFGTPESPDVVAIPDIKAHLEANWHTKIVIGA